MGINETHIALLIMAIMFIVAARGIYLGVKNTKKEEQRRRKLN